MPKIKTSSGYVKFKTVPIYLGVKQINKEISAENLKILKEVLDRNCIDFLIFYGTLLGAVREHDFITHDEDIDVVIKSEYIQKVFDSIPDLRAAGFEVARYDRRELMSVVRKGEYIDFYFFKPYQDDLRYCSGNLCPKEFIEESAPLHFKGEDYMAPRDYESFLRFEYGENWMTPVKWNNYSMPWWKKSILRFKEIFKDMLPDPIFFFFADRAALKQECNGRKKLERYRGSLENV